MGGGLSDYSDYDSDEEEEDDQDRQSEIAVATAGTTGAATAASAAAKDRRAVEEDLDDSASFASHRPRIGPRYASTIYSEFEHGSQTQEGHTGGEEEEDDFDPFADPDEDDDDGAEEESFDAEQFRRHNGPRETYAAV